MGVIFLGGAGHFETFGHQTSLGVLLYPGVSPVLEPSLRLFAVESGRTRLEGTLSLEGS